MAQAAPTSGGMAREARKRRRNPDIFSERTHAHARWAVPLALGLVYGYWAAAIRRFGGPITGWNLLFGFITTFVFAVVMAALLTVSRHVIREVHALMWFAFTGIAVGFLMSQSGRAIWYCVGLGLAVGAGVGLVLFYRYYIHEDEHGRRIGG